MYEDADEVVLGIGDAACEEMTDAGRLLPRCGTAPLAVATELPTGMLRDAGGAQSGHSLCHRSAADSTALKICRLGGIVKLR